MDPKSEMPSGLVTSDSPGYGPIMCYKLINKNIIV